MFTLIVYNYLLSQIWQLITVKQQTLLSSLLDTTILIEKSVRQNYIIIFHKQSCIPLKKNKKNSLNLYQFYKNIPGSDYKMSNFTFVVNFIVYKNNPCCHVWWFFAKCATSTIYFASDSGKSRLSFEWFKKTVFYIM